jgi:hypothetical protein
LGTYGIGVLFIIMTGDLDYPSNVFPYLISICILVFTTVILFSRVIAVPKEIAQESPQGQPKIAVFRVIFMAVFCILYVVLIPYAGFYFTSAIFLLTLFLCADPKNFSFRLLMNAAGLTIVVLLIVYLVFSYALNVPIPKGLFI